MGILLFNWFGYRVWLFYLETKATRQLEQTLDQERYDPSDLLTIRVPVATVAYNVHSAPFERVDGQIQIGGVSYNFVKRRLCNDSLELVCIANHAITHLQALEHDHSKMLSSTRFNLDEPYTLHEFFQVQHFQSDLPAALLRRQTGLLAGNLHTLDQPPDRRS